VTIEPQDVPTAAEIRRRQRSRARIMALALVLVAVLFYAITIVRISLL
jgi:hypothetical protein